MPKKNKFFNDISRMASSTVSTMLNVKDEISDYVNTQIKNAFKKMDFATKADIQALSKRISILEKGSLKSKKEESEPAKKMVKKVIKKTKPTKENSTVKSNKII